MSAPASCVPVVVWRPCRDCDGHGCATCAGLGQWPDPQELDLDAPTASQRRYLSGPLILHPGGECTPEWLRSAVVAGRLAQLWQERAGVAPSGQASGVKFRTEVYHPFSAKVYHPFSAKVYQGLSAKVYQLRGKADS